MVKGRHEEKSTTGRTIQVSFFTDFFTETWFGPDAKPSFLARGARSTILKE